KATIEKFVEHPSRLYEQGRGVVASRPPLMPLAAAIARLHRIKAAAVAGRPLAEEDVAALAAASAHRSVARQRHHLARQDVATQPGRGRRQVAHEYRLVR